MLSIARQQYAAFPGREGSEEDALPASAAQGNGRRVPQEMKLEVKRLKRAEETN